MRHEIIERCLTYVTYRPGWTITAHRHPFGTYVLIDAEVLDSEKYDSTLTVEQNYTKGNTTRVGVRACVPPDYLSLIEFYNWLEWRLGKVEHHEMREFFQVNGKPWDSPHKRVQPKHDYHVRKVRPGKWAVYRYDDPDLEVMSATTMEDAYLRAIYLVVQDDLNKQMIGPNG